LARVLLLNHNLVERGAYFRARETALRFHRLGHDVTFVCTGKQYYRPKIARRPRWTTLHTANWHLIKLDDDGLSPLGLAQRFTHLGGEFDLIYTFSHKPVDLFPAQWLRRHGGFWLADWCDLWSSDGGIYDYSQWGKPLPPQYRDWRAPFMRATDRWEQRLEERLVRSADAITIISSWMRGRTRALGVADEDVHLYVSGADTRRVSVLDKHAARRALGLPLDAPVVGYVANYTMDNMLMDDALARVWRAVPDMRFLAAGARFWGERTPVAAAHKRGLVVDRGRVPFAEIPQILAAADVLMLPMRDTNFNWSRWPHKCGDYLAAGRPIAMTRIGDMPDVIEKHRVGAVGDPTSEGLAGAVVDLLRRPTELDAMGARARGLAENEFSWDRQFAALIRFLRGRGVRV
jgi:glycosyltransferase involved in cell wall biosynthesis